MTVQTYMLNVEGMTCSGCVKSVENALNQLEGVKSVDVNLSANLATVGIDKSQLNIDGVIGAIEDAGFDASVIDE